MKKVKLIQFTPKRTFGVEMEWISTSLTRAQMKSIIQKFPNQQAKVANYTRNNEDLAWFCKTDSSCGFEVATRVMGDMDSVVKTIDDLELLTAVHKALVVQGAEVNSRCGTHVHMSLKNLTMEQLENFLLYWVKFEKFIFDILPRRRVHNTFCMHHSGSFRANRPYDTATLFNGFSGRSSVNLSRCGHLSTSRRIVEIRCGEGTKDPRNIKNWVAFLLHFVETVKNLPRPTNVNWVDLEEGLEMLQLINGHCGEFVLLDPHLSELREWLLARTGAYAKFKDAKKVRPMAKELHKTLYPTPYGG